MVLKLLPRYILTFGPLSGVSAFLQVEMFRSRRIFLKNYRYPINLRRKTTDRLAFREVFLHDSYKLPFNDFKVIIDGGANIGLTSIYFQKQFRDASIFAIEPDNSNYSSLCVNVEKLNLVTCIHSALWHTDAFLKIKDKKENEWAYSVIECDKEDPDAFAAISIASLMKRFSLQKIDLLKIDIEGSEKELFSENFDHWITRTRYIIVELHDWIRKDCSKSVFKTISSYNFTVQIINGMLLFINQDLE